MKKYLCFFVLLLGISTSLFAETWTSPQGQVFTFTNNTSISLKKGDLESIANYFYKWKNATMVLSLNKIGIPLCTAEIETEKYDVYNSDEYVPYLRSWIADKIDNKSQKENFLESGFLISSTHKLPNGSITQYGALRNSGYVKFDDDMIIKAGGYTGNFDNSASTVPKSTTNSCNAAYLYLYVTENYAKIMDLPIPKGLNNFKKEIEAKKKEEREALTNLYTSIENKKWNNVKQLITKYNFKVDDYFWFLETLVVPSVSDKLIDYDAPLEVWQTFDSLKACLKHTYIPISELNDESFFYIYSQAETEDIYNIKGVSDWKMLKILENRDDYIAKRLVPYFYDYENISQLEKLRTEMGASIETFYLTRIKLSDNNYYPSLLEKLCLKNKNKILDELLKTKIKYSLIVIAGKRGFASETPTEELLYFFTDKPDWKKEEYYCYSAKDNAFVYQTDSYSRTSGEQLQENNYFTKLYKDSIFKANYYFTTGKGFYFYEFQKGLSYLEIENNFYVIFKGYYHHSGSSANYFDKYATYPEWVNKSEDDHYICNLELKNSNNDTILMYAIQQGNLKFVSKLIKQGIDITAVNNDGKTALDIAIEVGDKKTEKELRKLLRK